MEIKTIESKKVFFTRLDASLQSLTADVGNKAEKILDDLHKLGIKETGPQEWVYIGSDGDPSKKFILDICLPVNEVIEGNEKFKILEEKTCAVEMHKGPWVNLGATYRKMLTELAFQKKVPGDVSREIYLRCDFVNQENSITEVQIELES